jgi:acyl carrier protein
MTSSSVREIVEVVIDYLAEYQQRSAEEVLEELAVGGEDLPVDSLLVVEILTRVEERFGVSVPADAQAGRSMRSVWAFSETVHDAMKSQQEEQ